MAWARIRFSRTDHGSESLLMSAAAVIVVGVVVTSDMRGVCVCVCMCVCVCVCVRE